MRVENRLSEADCLRARTVRPSPQMMAGAFLSHIEACDAFVSDHFVPMLRTLPQVSSRHRVLNQLHSRAMGYVKSVRELRAIQHYQSLIAASRSIVELSVDMHWIHRNLMPDAVERCEVFADWQRLKAAKRTVEFFNAHPELDANPSVVEHRRTYVQNREEAVTAAVNAIWPNGPPRDHWTGLNLLARSQRLGLDFEKLVTDDYDTRNFAIHSGLAGVFALDAETYVMLCCRTLKDIADSVMAMLRLQRVELVLDTNLPRCQELFDILDEVQVWSVADKMLQSLGEEQRYFIFQERL